MLYIIYFNILFSHKLLEHEPVTCPASVIAKQNLVLIFLYHLKYA